MNRVAPERVSDVAASDTHAESRSGTPCCSILRRRAARIFALLVIAVMVIDAVPDSAKWLIRPKQALSQVLDRAGLWQGGWSLFAPDPVLNNGWFTAEIEKVDSNQSQWNSPYWIESGGGDKFLRFRHLNYYNRLPTLRFHAAREDFVDYLARQSDVPVESIKLYHTRMRLIMPEDGSLPKRDEVDWMFSSEIVAKRTYQQPSSQQPSSQP